MKVFVNPGHASGGSPDPGAVNEEMGLRECDIALEIGSRAAQFLEVAGCEVKVLQSHNLAGESPGYPNVTAEANGWGADLFVSVHCNASKLHNARGFETFCYNAEGEGGKAAFFIQQEIYKGVRPFDPGFWDRGVKVERNFAVLRCTAMPAVLVEAGFIDNEYDARLLMGHSEEIAAAVARGVTDWWGSPGV